MPDSFHEHLPLREYDQRLTHLRELLEARLAEADKQLVRQAAEYERRLDVLNHAHAEALEHWQRTVPRELFEPWRDAMNAHVSGSRGMPLQIAALEAKLDALTTKFDSFEGGLALIRFGGLAGFLAMLGFLLRLFKGEGI